MTRRIAHTSLGAWPTTVTASAASRIMEGYAVTWNELGHTSVGPLMVRPGAIRVPEALASVKLVDEHRNPPVSIGYATAASVDDVGLRFAARVAATTTGQAALEDALEGARDAFSVELADMEIDAEGYVTSALLTAVALVTVPAFPGSRVDRVAASHTTTQGQGPNERTHMMLTPEQVARLAELRALETLTPEEAAELGKLTALEQAVEQAPEGDPAAAPADDAPPAAQAARRPAVTASMPSGIPGRRGNLGRHSLEDMYAAQARVLLGTSRPELEAALSNITATANPFVAPDAYAGELWSGLDYQRMYVPMLTTGKLTSRKVKGWRWVIAPEVADYAGDKTAVPSNAPTTEDVEATAARLAGAHDFDRAFVDFGDTEFIASYYKRMTNSYAVKSDRKARAALIAAANANVSATVGTDLLQALAIAKVQLMDYEDDDFQAGEPDWYLVNSTDYLTLLDVTTANAPAWLSELGVTVDKLRPSAAVPAGAVMAGVKEGGTFYELSDTPVRVETINIANGGVDGGVFGYWASIRHHDKGAIRVNWA